MNSKYKCKSLLSLGAWQAAAMLALSSPAFAQMTQPMPKKPGFGDILSNMLPVIIMVFLIFYFLVTRPQQLKLKQQNDLLSSLKKGDSVLTSGGIFARVASVEEDHILLEVASGVKVKFEKSAIAKRFEKADKTETKSQ